MRRCDDTLRWRLLGARAGAARRLHGRARITSARRRRCRPSYKEASAGWKAGASRPTMRSTAAPGGRSIDDPVLDGLERQIDISNQNLKAAEAAYRQAEAIVAEARAGVLPDRDARRLGAALAQQRQRRGATGRWRRRHAAPISSAQRPRRAGTPICGARSAAPSRASRQRPGERRPISPARGSRRRRSSPADYLQLRVADELKRLLDDSGRGLRRVAAASRRTSTRPASSPRRTWRRRETQLEQTRAQAIAVGVHARPARARDRGADRQAAGRADHRAAEPVDRACRRSRPACPRRCWSGGPTSPPPSGSMAAANAQIGVAEAAFYPDRHAVGPITASRLDAVGKLFTAASRDLVVRRDRWPQTLFDAGARQRARSSSAARRLRRRPSPTYRQTVLAAFQQVEDELAALRILAQQAAAQDAARRRRARGRAHHHQPVQGRHGRLHRCRRRPDDGAQRCERPRSTSGRAGSSPASR